MSHPIDRRHYADIYGPTTGDRIRLGDTGLVAEVEQDATVYGDECKFGGGKVLREPPREILQRHSANLARQDPGSGAHRQVDLDPRARQLRGDLGARVAAAHHQHPATAERLDVAVAHTVEERAAKAIPALELGHERP
jgi:hypothetical protein